MSVAFLTLLLGLISGPYDIQVSVAGPVAAVELLLDGSPVRRIQGPPWVGRVDFGPGLEPHELVARALDREGQEVARARQWVNLPRPRAEIEIALEADAKGRATAARLTWMILTGEKPASVSLLLDGQPLALDASNRAQLPVYDPASAHVLSAEARFSLTDVARKDVVFGGQFGSEVFTELTAVPVRLRKGASLPPVERLQGWFSAGGQPLPVAAVEEGPGEVIVVRSAPGREVLAEMGSYGGKPRGWTQEEALRTEMLLGKEERVRFVSPIPRRHAGSGLQSDLFDISALYTREAGGLYWLVRNIHPRPVAAEPRLADALAVAGLQAAADNHRRVLVLVLGDEQPDASVFDPMTVRRFLAALRVPLYVWTLREPTRAQAAAWGPGDKVAALRGVYKGVNDLKEDLESQRIVWVEGRHLPQSITLAPAAAPFFELLPGGPRRP